MARKDKLTQKKTAFYILWKARKEDPEQWVPAWRFVGEFYLKEIDQWFFMSYKGPTNGLDIYKENPGLIERRETIGKTGARYYEYRIVHNPSFSLIKDEDLQLFAKLIERRYKIQQSGQGELAFGVKIGTTPAESAKNLAEAISAPSEVKQDRQDEIQEDTTSMEEKLMDVFDCNDDPESHDD